MSTSSFDMLCVPQDEDLVSDAKTDSESKPIRARNEWETMPTSSGKVIQTDTNNIIFHIEKMKKFRDRIKHLQSPKMRIYHLYCLTRTKAFCEWYYSPQRFRDMHRVKPTGIAHYFGGPIYFYVDGVCQCR